MSEYLVTVEVNEEYAEQVSSERLEEIVREVLSEENIPGPVEVELLLIDDEEMRRLNAEYRQIDETTDVLAFALREGGERQFVLPPDLVSQLGNVVISYPRSVEQAKEAGHSIEREIVILAIHGVLHLLGFDHVEEEEAAAMQEKERIILSKTEFDEK